MRLVLLAFALAVLTLQWQPALPRLAHAWWLVVPLAIAAVAMVGAGSGQSRRSSVLRAVALTAVTLSVGLAGFFYAAWCAQTRLADELPAEWEGVDIAVVGVIDELPQPDDHGTRFAFAVERVLTPGAVVPARLSLAWYA